MSFIVYIHTTPNGKKYIGITQKKPKERWRNGKGYDTQYFGKAIKKYGWKNIKHEIIEEGLTEEQAEIKEKELILLYKTNDIKFGYNIESGGKHNTCSEETRKKMSTAQKALHKKIPDWHKEINRKAQLGRKHTAKEIEKRASKIRGKSYVMGEYQRQKILEAMKKIPPEKRAEQFAKAIATRKSRTYNTIIRGKKLLQKDLQGNVINTYISIAEAIRQNRYDRKNLYLAVKEKRKAYGCFWEVDDSPNFKKNKR